MKANVTAFPISRQQLQTITLTPELAMQLLERNGLNRPLNEQHVSRIARQIKTGKWRFNGDSIKIANSEDILDGQHRLWAVIEAKKPVDTVIVYGIEREAFATIDTLRKPRSGSDVLALAGNPRHRAVVAQAIVWLLRWRSGKLLDYQQPKNRIENSDIEECYVSNGGMVQAAERTSKLRRVANPALLTFLYYIIVNRNADLAERMVRTLEYPSAVGIDDPFFCLRSYFLSDHQKAKMPLVTIALTIKAANAANNNQKMKILNWRNQGDRPEPFPELKIDAVKS
jgi:hypothetical protein